MKNPVKVSAVLVVLLITLTGCVGGGGGVDVKAQVNAAIDKWLNADLAEDASQMSSVLTSKVTITTVSDTGESVTVEMDRSNYIQQQQDWWDLFSTETIQVTGRVVTVSGGSATVTGYVLQDYKGDFTGTQYRLTGNVEIGLVKSGDSWYLTSLKMSNVQDVER